MVLCLKIQQYIYHEKDENKLFGEKPSVNWTDNCAVKCDLCKGEICGDICCSIGKCKSKKCDYDNSIVVENCNEHKVGRLSCKLAQSNDPTLEESFGALEGNSEFQGQNQQMPDAQDNFQGNQMVQNQNGKVGFTDNFKNPVERSVAFQGMNMGFNNGYQEGMMMAHLNAQQQIMNSNMMTEAMVNQSLSFYLVQMETAMQMAQLEEKKNPEAISKLNQVDEIFNELKANAASKDDSKEDDKRKGKRKNPVSNKKTKKNMKRKNH